VRKVPKPWGHELIFAENERYAGKLLVLEPGHRLSLQYHQRKDETIYVLEGEVDLLVDIDGEMRELTLKAGDSHRIRPGRPAPHEREGALHARRGLFAGARRRRAARRRVRAGRHDGAVRRTSLVSGLWSLVLAAGPSFAATHPSPTPTPRGRLSGGFGRPRATATPSDPTSSGRASRRRPPPRTDGRASEKPAGAEKSGVRDRTNRSLITGPEEGGA
jgi:hypothetical protein